MQDRKRNTIYITKIRESHHYLLSGEYEVHAMDLMNDKAMQPSSTTNRKFSPTNTKTNVISCIQYT